MIRNNIEPTTAVFMAQNWLMNRVIVASSGLAQVGLESLFAKGGPMHTDDPNRRWNRTNINIWGLENLCRSLGRNVCSNPWN